jgi:succinate dehydrogenase flavin-adding protein (antitoxin of CptAB toxin-antitoxin module)
VETFEQELKSPERRILARLTTPGRIQGFLDECAYSIDEANHCPLFVLRRRAANCFDGAVFAAAALHRLGYPPLILDMLANNRDDDHILALYKRGGHWGALAKSNFTGLRFREPVYRTLRELVMSYFEQYYNTAREKTLRGYTRPLNLRTLDALQWMTDEKAMERIEDRLVRMPQKKLLTRAMIAGLFPVDERTRRAGLLDANTAGLYKPQHKPKNR